MTIQPSCEHSGTIKSIMRRSILSYMDDLYFIEFDSMNIQLVIVANNYFETTDIKSSSNPADEKNSFSTSLTVTNQLCFEF